MLAFFEDVFHFVLVDDHPLVCPADDEEGVEGDAELFVVDLGDVLDVDPHVDDRLRSLVGQVELGVVGRDADGLPLGAHLGRQSGHVGGRQLRRRRCRRH